MKKTLLLLSMQLIIASSFAQITYIQHGNQAPFNQPIGANLNDRFLHNGVQMAHYGIGWYTDYTWSGIGPSMWVSAYGGMKFFTAEIPRLTINVSGNIGIGTISPEYKLDVVGAIRAHEILVNTQKWADFVFTPQYKLRALSEVEMFINENGHLPEIPTVTEVEQNGINVGDIQGKLLQKIEELTLYIIEQDKHSKKLEAKIDELERSMKNAEHDK